VSTSFLSTYAPVLFEGVALTLGFWLASLVFSVVLGFGIFALSKLPYRCVKWFVKAYVVSYRGTPLLFQLFLLYYGGPQIGVALSAYTVAIVGCGMYGAAYFSQIFRSGFDAISRGQVEAGLALGMSSMQIAALVQIPQMAVMIIPPSVNQSIILLKDTSILSIITIPELSAVISRITNETFIVIEPYLLLSATYWLLVEGISGTGVWLERRYGKHLPKKA
jgi:polar amino acid transport system permease protein